MEIAQFRILRDKLASLLHPTPPKTPCELVGRAIQVFDAREVTEPDRQEDESPDDGDDDDAKTPLTFVRSGLATCARLAASLAARNKTQNDDEDDEDEDEDVGENECEEGTAQLKSQVVKCLELLYYLDHALQTSMVCAQLAACLNDPQAKAPTKKRIASGLARFSPMEDSSEANRPHQKLLLYLLNRAYLRGYRRYGADMYERNFRRGTFTRSWRKVLSIQDFVYQSAHKEINFEQWCNMTACSGGASAAAEHLLNCRDYQLPDLVKDRHLFAFRNGAYDAARDVFFPHDATDKNQMVGDAACKFFDLDFPGGDHSPDEDPMSIPTPHIDSILLHQKLEPDVMRWLFVFLGRLMYAVGERDDWQVMPFFKGQAGTGKSTILMKIAAAFYEAEDVGVMSNNIERKFGIYAFADKLLFVAPEIKGDLQIEQAEFQSMVSGEMVQLNIKCKKAETKEWRVPGVLAGNEVPNWTDNAGSIARRLVVFDFCQRVNDADIELGKKLSRELPAIMLKCNRAYRRAVADFGKRSIWSALPSYFHDTKKDLVENVNSLEAFLSSCSDIALDPEAYMAYRDFLHVYDSFCDSVGMAKLRKSKDFKARLEQHGLVIEKGVDRAYPRTLQYKMKGVEWILGVDLADAASKTG